jgi:flagellar L-ring protein precursor FlgH
LSKILPEGVNPNSLVSLGSSSKSIGSGEVDRSETITMTIAAVVTQILPNGNMVIWGHQEVRVNFEVRELMVDGVIRPEDISSSNTIKHTQIAEARIAYGGRGQLTDVQQPRYGQQVLDIILPF